MASGENARRFGSVLVLVVALVTGCGGGSSGTGIPASTKVSVLTDAQQKTLCDYVNGKRGGYEKTIMCPDNSTFQTDPTQDDCVLILKGAAGCMDLTVGDIEGCANGPMGNACTFATAPECKNVYNCFNAA